MREPRAPQCSVRTAIALIVVCFLPRPAVAWGDEGHRIIGMVADRFPDAAAREKVAAMLSADPDNLTAHDIASEMTWADRYRDIGDVHQPLHAADDHDAGANGKTDDRDRVSTWEPSPLLGYGVCRAHRHRSGRSCRPAGRERIGRTAEGLVTRDGRRLGDGDVRCGLAITPTGCCRSPAPMASFN
jgi:hypothetical protein